MPTLTTVPALETRQLILREIEARDAEAFSGFMMQEAYQRHITMRLSSEAEVKAFVSRAVSRQGDERRNVFHLAAEEKYSEEAIGDGFLILQSPGNVEVGWGVHPALWRMGFGTEIGEALLALAFERFMAKKCWCKVMAGNEASQKLARRLGMKQLQSSSGAQVGSNRHVDVTFYGMSAERYFELPY